MAIYGGRCRPQRRLNGVVIHAMSGVVFERGGGGGGGGQTGVEHVGLSCSVPVLSCLEQRGVAGMWRSTLSLTVPCVTITVM